MMDVEAQIVAVTVYPDRARITRRGSVVLEVGPHELQVSDLTLLLDSDSVRAAGQGSARVRILGVDVRQEYYTETPSASASDLTHQLEEKQDADQALQDELLLLDSQLGMLGNMSEQAGQSLARGIGRGRAKVTDGNALLAFLASQHTLFSTRRRAIAVERRVLSAEMRVLKRELDRIKGARPRERYLAVVGVEALTEGEFTLELEYTTAGGAGWSPLYDLRLLEEGETPEVEISYLGQVRQSTGEDWLDVDLTLSTARPAVSADLPELSPWYVRVYEPPRPVAAGFLGASKMSAPARAAGAVVDQFFAEAEEAPSAPAPEPVVAQAVEAEIDTSGAAVTFHIPRRADVPADNTPHKITVLTLQFEPELDYYSVPKLVSEVYRRARVRNDSEVTLLPGPVSLFHGGEYVGKATLPKVAPQETFETTMGIDDRIVVQRELVLKEVGKQFIGDRRVLRYAYEISVQNLLPQPAQIVVGDQLPVAAHESIRVKAEELDPPSTTESEQGEITWKRTLASQEKTKLRLEFTVNAPRSVRLVGLPDE